MTKILKFAFFAFATLATPVAAEVELSFYTGTQSVRGSNASGTLPDGTPFSGEIDWEGNPFDNPIYYGARAMWWNDNGVGLGVEATHTKAIAPDGQAAAIGFDRLEGSDGHNIFTLNLMKRWDGAFLKGNITPYVGGGIGFAFPHIDAIVTGSSGRTFGFEITGPAVRGIAGMKYDFTERWAIFTEYQFTWSDNDITIDPDPAVPGQPSGELNTDLLTHALNVGLSFSF